MKFKLLDTFLADGFYLTQEYGTNKYFDYTKFGLLAHEGCDYSHVNKTKEIRAVHNGTCLTAYDNAYGRYVIVLDYELLCATYYCHLSKTNIVSGQEVKAGDVIGNMGSTGNSTGAHLHFNFVIINSSGVRQYKELRYNQGFLDPLYPRDSSTPKKYGIDYDIEWVKSIPMSDMITIKSSLFEELVGKASKFDAFVSAGYPDVSTVSKEIVSLKSSIASRDKKIAELNNTLVAKDVLIADYKSKIADLSSQLTVCQTDKEVCRLSYEKLQVEYKELEKFYASKIQVLETHIEELKKQVVEGGNTPVTETEAVGILTRLLNAIKDFLKW